MNTAYAYLMEAQSYIDSYVDESLADIFFEADSDAAEKNEEASKGAVNAIKKAIQALKDLVKKIIKSLSDFFKVGFMSKEDKENYKKFKMAVQQNPELKDEKITIEDFRLYEKIYDQAIKDLEKEAGKEDPDTEKADQIANKFMEAMKVIGVAAGDELKSQSSKVAISTTLSAAIDIAEGNRLAAKSINFALQNELIKLDAVEKELGEARAIKFKKQINKISKRCYIHRRIVQILKHKDGSLQSVLKRQQKKFMACTNLGNKEKLKKDGIFSAGTLIKAQINPMNGKEREFLRDMSKGSFTGIMDQVDMDLSRRTMRRDIKEFKNLFKKK